MSYGVYSKDLKGQTISNCTLDTARRYTRSGYVIAKEKDITIGWTLSFGTHTYNMGFRWHRSRYYKELCLWYLSILLERKTIRWADPQFIVYDYDANHEEQ